MCSSDLIGGGHCSRCKIEDPIILAFHHLNREDKSETISNIIRGNGKNCSKKALELEVSKCIVLCGNCHAEIHCKDNLISKNELLRYLGGIDFCSQCGYQSNSGNLSSLHFHHLDGFEKKFEISSVYSRASKYPRFNRDFKEIKDELKKCIVICKNCHTVRHAHYERFMRLRPLILSKADEWVIKQNKFELSGKTRINRFNGKHNKRYERNHKSDPNENPCCDVCNDSPKDRITEEFEKRLLNI